MISSAGTSTCRVCGTTTARTFELTLLGRQVGYFDCRNCGYLQTEMPYWLEEAYAQPINTVDTGIMARNLANVGRVIMTLIAYQNTSGTVVDHAGGFGILVRLLRDAGIEAEWRDLYCQNLVAKGFEAIRSSYDLLTAFEVLEHFVDPVDELRKLLGDAPVVLVSTELVPTEETPRTDWWYLGPEHGQHIGFFRGGTLARIAADLDCFTASHGNSLHIFSRERIPRSWAALQGCKGLWPLWARLRRKSKVGTDFEAMRRRRED